MATPAATKRLLKELEAYNKSPSPVIPSLSPKSDDNLLELEAEIVGPNGTPYENGTWTLTLTLPPTYPSLPPLIKFLTPIAHPNIDFSTGEICLDLLKPSSPSSSSSSAPSGWTPTYGLITTLEAIQNMLYGIEGGADPDSPLNVDLARLWRRGDWVGARALVRFYTGVYAVEKRRRGGDDDAGRERRGDKGKGRGR